jgi:hypothetical protein
MRGFSFSIVTWIILFILMMAIILLLAPKFAGAPGAILSGIE